jgi:uncharacterized protein YxjI
VTKFETEDGGWNDERRNDRPHTYGIEIEPGEDAALILASTVCIDQMARG